MPLQLQTPSTGDPSPHHPLRVEEGLQRHLVSDNGSLPDSVTSSGHISQGLRSATTSAPQSDGGSAVPPQGLEAAPLQDAEGISEEAVLPLSPAQVGIQDPEVEEEGEGGRGEENMESAQAAADVALSAVLRLAEMFGLGGDVSSGGVDVARVSPRASLDLVAAAAAAVLSSSRPSSAANSPSAKKESGGPLPAADYINANIVRDCSPQ